MASKLTFEQRVARMDRGLRELCVAIRDAISEVPEGYDRAEDLPSHLDMLLHGGRTLNGASLEVIAHIRNTFMHYDVGEKARRVIDMITEETRRRHQKQVARERKGRR